MSLFLTLADDRLQNLLVWSALFVLGIAVRTPGVNEACPDCLRLQTGISEIIAIIVGALDAL